MTGDRRWFNSILAPGSLMWLVEEDISVFVSHVIVDIANKRPGVSTGSKIGQVRNKLVENTLHLGGLLLHEQRVGGS